MKFLMENLSDIELDNNFHSIKDHILVLIKTIFDSINKLNESE